MRGEDSTRPFATSVAPPINPIDACKKDLIIFHVVVSLLYLYLFYLSTSVLSLFDFHLSDLYFLHLHKHVALLTVSEHKVVFLVHTVQEHGAIFQLSLNVHCACVCILSIELVQDNMSFTSPLLRLRLFTILLRNIVVKALLVSWLSPLCLLISTPTATATTTIPTVTTITTTYYCRATLLPQV